MTTQKKLPKTYKGKSTRPGGGGRFAMRVDELIKKGMSREAAEAQTAKEGREEYGQAQMTKWSVQGKKRAAKKRGK